MTEKGRGWIQNVELDHDARADLTRTRIEVCIPSMSLATDDVVVASRLLGPRDGLSVVALIGVLDEPTVALIEAIACQGVDGELMAALGEVLGWPEHPPAPSETDSEATPEWVASLLKP